MRPIRPEVAPDAPTATVALATRVTLAALVALTAIVPCCSCSTFGSSRDSPALGAELRVPGTEEIREVIIAHYISGWSEPLLYLRPKATDLHTKFLCTRSQGNTF